MTSSAAPRLTEAQFMRQVTELAEIRGWQWAHFRPAITSKGWRTPVSGPLGKGWPDLVLVRNDSGGHAYIIFAELKAEGGKLTQEQQFVVDMLTNWDFERNTETHVWRPSDWAAIEEALR